MASEVVTGSLYTLSVLLPQQIRNKIWLRNWTDYQFRVAQRIRMLNDDWDDQLVNYIISLISDETRNHYFKDQSSPKWPLPTHLNIFKRVCEEISLIYKNPANRWFEMGPDEPDKNQGMEITGSDQIAPSQTMPDNVGQSQ